MEHIQVCEEEPFWMQELRKKAFDNYVALDMPSLQYGLRVGISLDIDFDGLTADCKEKVVITNNSDVVVKTFSEAAVSHPAIMKQLLGTVVAADNKFTALHYARMNRGVLIYIPRNTSGEVQLDFPCSGNVFDQVLVFAEENSSVKIISRSSGSCHFRSEVVEVVTHDNAQVTFVHMHDIDGVTFSVKKAICNKDACVRWIEGCVSGTLTRSQVINLLQGEGASGYNYGLFYGDKDQIFDLVAQNIHEVGHTTSDMLTKGALDGDARVIYRGMVKICSGARNSNGYQKEETLLLSDHAQADIIPDLVIDNNEVKCSHGATIKRLGEEELFYLRSRGLNKKEAQGKLVEGFFEEMISKVENEGLQTVLREKVSACK